MATADAPRRHGFDRAQVQQHIANLESNLRILTADRDTARAELAKLTQEVAALREQATGTTQPIAPSPDVHSQLQVMLEVTKAEAAEITARAQAAAEQTFASAQKAAAALRSRYEFLVADLETQQTQLQAEHAAALEELRTQLTQMSTDAENRRSKFGEQAEQRHKQVEREFEAAMAAKRAELDQEIAARREASQQQAAKVLGDATADAERRTAEADQRLNHLNTLRQRVSERLRETSQLLTQSGKLLEPLDNEADVISGKQPS
jgi:colicin import membrane protein